MTIADLGGRIVEGWRASATPGTDTYDPLAASTPVYRQSAIGKLRLILDPEHRQPPRLATRWCVQPGDVVLNKLAPLRAALVPAAARRHPVDGNSLIVRDLPAPDAAWLATCLNHAEYEALLLIESGILRRVGIGPLSGLRLPAMPPGFAVAAAAVFHALDNDLLIGEDLHRAAVEANQEVSLPESRDDLRSGVKVQGSVVAHDSWLP